MVKLETLTAILKEHVKQPNFLCVIAAELARNGLLDRQQAMEFIAETRARISPHYTLCGTEQFFKSGMRPEEFRRAWLLDWIDQKSDHRKMPSRLDRIKVATTKLLAKLFKV